jgi:hypothetical protein
MALSLAFLLAIVTIPALVAYALLRRLTKFRKHMCLLPAGLIGGATLAAFRMLGEYEAGFCCYEHGVPSFVELLGYFAADTLLFSLASLVALCVIVSIWEVAREMRSAKVK